MLVSSGVRTLDISLKTGQGPLKSVTPWAADTGGLSLSCGLFLHEHQQASEGKLRGESWERFTCMATQGMQMVGIAGTLHESISSFSSMGSFCLHGKGPHIFPPEVTVEIYSTWGTRTGKFYCWQRSRKAS